MLLKKTNPRAHRAALVPALLLALLSHGDHARAADASPAAQYTIEQPAQPLADALRAIAHETGRSVLFDPGAVRGRVAHAVSGHLSALEAITAALQGTGLTAAVMEDGGFLVRSAGASKGTPASAVPASVPSADAGQAGNAVAAAASADAAREDVTTLAKVEITGSRLKRINAEGPAPVNIYTAKDIEQSGQPNLQQFLMGLNEVSASAGEGGFSRTLGQGTVQLRGLPLGSTLVLINGRRVEAVGSSPASYFNLNLIPTAAIERVEIVPVGSSAVYGGDALAGVVNVILKKSIDGVSVEANLGSGRGFGNGGVSLGTGGQNANGSFLLMGSYSRDTPLTTAERGFFRDADYRRYGGPDARERYCVPGTVSSVSGDNLPGLGSSFAAIPKLAAGQAPQLSDFAATAGTANLCNYYANGNGTALVYDDDTLALHAMGEYRIGRGWTGFSELTFARQRTQSRDLGLGLIDVTVPATNLYNPFGEDVQVAAVLGPSNGLQGYARQTRFARVLAGLRGGLGGDWETELTLSTARDSEASQELNGNRDDAALDAALAASSPAASLDPFTTGRAASQEVLAGIWSDQDQTSHGRKDQVSALARGALLRLPAGAVETVVGVESARDHFGLSQPEIALAIHDSRHNSAAFGELRAPLFNAGEAAGAWNVAALTVAARRDRYSDFGSANTYQAGLELRPVRSLLLRASSATSFKPPTLLETHVPDSTYPLQWFGLVDPARGGEAITSGTLARTTNTDLTPERGRATSFGTVWEPEGSVGTRLSATHWQVRINGLIAILAPQTALDYELLFPGFVTRGPAVDGQPGQVTKINYSEVNYGTVDVAGTDLEAAYAWRALMGRWVGTIAGTRTNQYQVALAPGAATQDRLGRRFSDYWAPRWKSRASIAYDTDAWSVGLTGRYLGQYRDAGTSERRLGAYWMYDLAGSLNLKKLLPDVGSVVKGASLSLSVANLTNRQPQFVETSPYYDTTQADWRGRFVSTRVAIDW